jgi:hypothetical protein
MLALHGFDAYGLEISQTAVSEAERYASAEMADPGTHNFAPARNREGKQPGAVRFVEGDFFVSDWQSGEGGDAQFDLIYDYTVRVPFYFVVRCLRLTAQFLCALHPARRRDWSSRMASLLKKGGLLVCLEFPMYKDPKLPGPPWGLKGVHWDLLSRGGDGLAAGDAGEESGSSNGQFTRELYIKPERTYEMGKGTDMLSVYVRK